MSTFKLLSCLDKQFCLRTSNSPKNNIFRRRNDHPTTSGRFHANIVDFRVHGDVQLMEKMLGLGPKEPVAVSLVCHTNNMADDHRPEAEPPGPGSVTVRPG